MCKMMRSDDSWSYFVRAQPSSQSLTADLRAASVAREILAHSLMKGFA
jgi:hypothetical protein